MERNDKAADFPPMVCLTGLWENRTRAGELYFAGTLSPSAKILIFMNRRKSAENQPDYLLYVAAPQQRDRGDAVGEGRRSEAVASGEEVSA